MRITINTSLNRLEVSYREGRMWALNWWLHPTGSHHCCWLCLQWAANNRATLLKSSLLEVILLKQTSPTPRMLFPSTFLYLSSSIPLQALSESECDLQTSWTHNPLDASAWQGGGICLTHSLVRSEMAKLKWPSQKLFCLPPNHVIRGHSLGCMPKSMACDQVWRRCALGPPPYVEAQCNK